MFCTNCGKEIPDDSAFCPECGSAQPGTTPPPVSNANGYVKPAGQPVVQKAPYNTICIVGLVLSCISLVLNFWGIVGIAATVVSVIGLINCKQKNENGKGLAVIGIIIGSLSIIYGVFSLVSLFSLIAEMGA